MFRFIIGAVAGSLAIWLWGEELKRYATTSTRAVRERAAETLQSVERRPVAFWIRQGSKFTQRSRPGRMQCGPGVLKQPPPTRQLKARSDGGSTYGSFTRAGGWRP